MRFEKKNENEKSFLQKKNEKEEKKNDESQKEFMVRKMSKEKYVL